MRCLSFIILVGITLHARANLTLDIDYSLDTNGFFNPGTANGQAARATLARAAQWHTDRYMDSWSAIVPGGGNTWTARFTHPSSGQAEFTISNMTIPANTMKVFAGARSLTPEYGKSGPGGYTASSAFGDTAFTNAVQYRGQPAAAGAAPTDFGTWGGGLAFDTGANWHFGLDAPPAGKVDFYSVAIHELAHLLGFGTAASFTTTYTSGTSFTGPKAKADNGGADVPLTPGEVPLAHWSNSVQGKVGGALVQAAMSDIALRQRKPFTSIDFAAMDDIGYILARPGDADADGVVGFNDLLLVSANYGRFDGFARWADGDFDGDGSIAFPDLLVVSAAYGQTGPLAAAQAELMLSTVPEPGVPLAIAGLAALLLKRNRKARSL
jgi:hypothetical protein